MKNSAIATASLTIIICLSIAFSTFALDPISGDGHGSQMREVNYLYASPLTVFEEITDIGGGHYRYTYHFENVDNKNIWHFGIFTAFPVSIVNSTWDELPSWEYFFSNELDNLHPAYEPSNIDPTLVGVVGTWGPNWPNTPDPISPSMFVFGLSFEANTLDSSPKLYFYETAEDGYAQDTGYIAAIGFTYPNTVATDQDSWGSIKALYR